MKAQALKKPRASRKKKVNRNPPIALSGFVWSHGLLAEEGYAQDRALGDNIPAEGDLRIYPLDSSTQTDKLGFLRAGIFNGRVWRALSLRDGIGDIDRAAYASLEGATPLFRSISEHVRDLARSANCTCVWGNSAYYVPNRKMITRLVIHAKDPVPSPDAKPVTDKTALDLLRDARAKKPKVEPAIVLSGTVWSHLRLVDVAPEVELGEKTPMTGDIRLWPVDRHEDPRARGLFAGSIFDGKRWRALNLSRGISEIEDTTYLGQEEMLALFRRVGRAIKRQTKSDNCMALSGGSHYFVLSAVLFKEFQAEQAVISAHDPPSEPEPVPVVLALEPAPVQELGSDRDAHDSTTAGEVVASRVSQGQLFEPMPQAPTQEVTPKRRTATRPRCAGNKPEKPPQLPGFEEDERADSAHVASEQ